MEKKMRKKTVSLLLALAMVLTAFCMTPLAASGAPAALPSIVSVTPSWQDQGVEPSGQILITFSKTMDPARPGIVNLSAVDGDLIASFDLSTASWTSDDKTVMIPYAGLSYATRYELYMRGFTAADGTVMNGSLLIRFTTMDEPPSYQITFDAAGGDKIGTALALKTGDLYGKLPVAVRKGHTFTGWYTAPAGGTAVQETAPFTLTADQTLYARWTPNVYTLRFHVNRGEPIQTKSIKVTFGAKVGALPKSVPRRLGYKFLSWYTAKTNGKKYTAKTTYGKAGNTVLYAGWTPLYNRAIPKAGQSKVAIRTKPDSTSKVLGYYRKGQVFTVIKKHLRKDGTCDYLQVKYKGRIAWVRSYHVNTFKVYAKQ